MVTLRLFAGLRDAAGTSRVEVPGSTVGEVVDAAVDRFGPGFAAGLERARIWLNGEEADRADPVADGDEVALLPPVSGGADAVRQAGLLGVGPFVALAVLVLANLAEGEAWWAAAVVGTVGLWVGDVGTTVAMRGRDIPLVPPLLSILVAIVAVHLVGTAGLGLALVGAVVLTLAWGVASDTSRPLQALAPALVLAVIASSAVGSLDLSRRAFEQPARVVGVFLVAMAAALVVMQAVERLPRLPVGDPYSTGAVAAILGALAGAAFWGLDLVAFLIAGIALAVALVGGRSLGSILRTRQVVLLEPAPGMLAPLDGIVLAAALYLPALRLVL